MATIRLSIWKKIRNKDYCIPAQYRRPFVYIAPPFTLYWTGSIQCISSFDKLIYLLVGIGNGDVGNKDHNVTSLFVPASIYTLYDDLKFTPMLNKWNH